VDNRQILGALAVLLTLLATPVGAGGDPPSTPTASAAIADAARESSLRSLLFEVLDRNPEIASAVAKATAERHRSASVSALPDPRAELTAYLAPPETRVGPQLASLRLSQDLPGGGKRGLRARSAGHEAAALASEVEAIRLRLVTETRRAFHEIAYLDAAADVVSSDRQILAHFEELARARYSSGSGLQQEVVTIQAEITRIDARLSELRERRAGWVATLNALCDRPGRPIPPVQTPPHRPVRLDWRRLREHALAMRPEMALTAARVAGAESASELARKRGGPDFSLGLVYAYVDRREDANPPDNGQDIFGISGGITLPVWRGAVDEGIELAAQQRLSAEEERRRVISAIDRQLGELRGQLPEIDRRLQLFEGILGTQTEQALRSAEAAYAAGRLDAVALLEAERTLLDVRLAAERTRADHAIAIARLEGAIAAPLASLALAQLPGGAS
jgi:outer membrane protein TolC